MDFKSYNCLNRKHEMFLNTQSLIFYRIPHFLNRKHEMFLNATGSINSSGKSSLTVNMKCF